MLNICFLHILASHKIHPTHNNTNNDSNVIPHNGIVSDTSQYNSEMAGTNVYSKHSTNLQNYN